MAEFSQAIDALLRHEGGFAPSDNNRGAVNFGWTAATLKRLGLPHSTEDVRALTRERAAGLYAMHFWTPLRLSEIKDQRLATLVFSMAVNMGPHKAVGMLQRSVNDALDDTAAPGKLAVDGALGPRTVRAINALDPQLITLKYKGWLAGEYKRLAEGNPALYGDDLRGWLARLEELTA